MSTYTHVLALVITILITEAAIIVRLLRRGGAL